VDLEESRRFFSVQNTLKAIRRIRLLYFQNRLHKVTEALPNGEPCS
jgi:hypothetical protein